MRAVSFFDTQKAVCPCDERRNEDRSSDRSSFTFLGGHVT
jgi:hypothetical protein